MQQLENALLKAHDAGDTEAARVLAGEIRTMRTQPQAQLQKASLADSFSQGALNVLAPIGNAASGALRGIGSMGATILAPIDIVSDAMDGKGFSLESNRERRRKMDEGLKYFGADPDSWMYKGGKLAGETVAGAGLAGMIAKGAQALNAAPPLVNALRTFGSSAGASTPARDLATRVAGGAISGGLTAGAINPEDAAMGAAVGGALPVVLRAARGGVDLGRNLIGATTGAGDKALLTAFESGRAGGAQGQSFRDNMRGKVPLTDVLDDARANLGTMRNNASQAYRNDMAAVAADKTVLDLNPVSQSIDDAIANFSYKGQAKNPKALEALEQVRDQVNTWKQLDPVEFHTAEGLDALKQQIGATLQGIPIESTDVRKAVNGVYNSVKSQISNQAPVYAKTMKDYGDASQLIGEIEKSVLGGKRATDDSAMRKLQSVMRNNVNTNFGVRTAAAEALEQNGGRELMSALAGQSLNTWMPRGIQRATSPLMVGGAVMSGSAPAAIGSLAASSPRLMGEASYALGRASPIIEALRRGTYYSAPALVSD